MVEYEGIIRELNPEWLGWVILDLLTERIDETEEYRAEIQIQLDYEVKVFWYLNN